MSMEDVWVETIHESERRAGKKIDTVSATADSEDKVTAMDTKQRPVTTKDKNFKDTNLKDTQTKAHRGQKKKRAA